MPGTWQPLATNPPANVETMLLLTDGSVMAHQTSSPNWHRLRANAAGDYMQGTWSAVAPMPNNALIPGGQGGPTYAPLYFASAVLRDGTMFVAGGEYNTGIPNSDVIATQIYDPVLDTWRIVNPPSNWTVIGDAPSCVLPDGRLLLGNINGTQTAIYHPISSSWSAAANKADSNSEEGYTLLPDGTVLVPEVTNHPLAEKYVPTLDAWVSAGSVPPWLRSLQADDRLVRDRAGDPASRRPSPGYGRERAYRDLYSSGAAHPTGKLGRRTGFPGQRRHASGSVRRARVSVAEWPRAMPGRTAATKWLGGKSLRLVRVQRRRIRPGAGAPPLATEDTYNFRMLLLPTGQVLLSHTDGNDVWIYTPDGFPRHAWRPRISHVPRRLHHDGAYKLRGRQLNGLSQANAYGDDAQMATNYPLVRLHGVGGGPVVYCRTFDHSTMGVATRHREHHTYFQVPANTPHGPYRLVVVANGIPSEPVHVRVVRHVDEDEVVGFVQRKPVAAALLALVMGYVLGRL